MKNSESFDAQREPSSYSSKSNSLFANGRGTEKTFSRVFHFLGEKSPPRIPFFFAMHNNSIDCKL